MSPIEIIVIIGVVLALALIIVGGIIGRAKAKKNGDSCCGCAGCRHAASCDKSNVAVTDDSNLSIIETDTETDMTENSNIDVDTDIETDKSDI